MLFLLTFVATTTAEPQSVLPFHKHYRQIRKTSAYVLKKDPSSLFESVVGFQKNVSLLSW